jgi:hypothetical protein
MNSLQQKVDEFPPPSLINTTLGFFLSFETTNFYESICHDSCVCVVRSLREVMELRSRIAKMRVAHLEKNAARREQRLGSSHENKGAL